MLPEWPPSTVTILATAGEAPHAIPVSAAVRAGPRRALLGLAGTRRSLARLRADPRVSLAIVAENLAVTAHGRARVLDEELVEGVVAVEIEVDAVQDHDRPTLAIESGVRWAGSLRCRAARLGGPSGSGPAGRTRSRLALDPPRPSDHAAA